MQIPDRVIDEVYRLLREGKLSQRKIAIHLGISRTVVSNLFLGKRPGTRGKSHRKVGSSYRRIPLKAEAKRCPDCGGMVIMPCLSCKIENSKQGGE